MSTPRHRAYVKDDSLIDVRSQHWYPRYLDKICTSINDHSSKTKFSTTGGKIKLIGIEGCSKLGAATRAEWTALLEDIDTGVNSGDIQCRPTNARIKIDELVVELEWCKKGKEVRHIIMASCPAIIIDGNGVRMNAMEQVRSMAKEYEHVHILFSSAQDYVEKKFVPVSDPRKPKSLMDHIHALTSGSDQEKVTSASALADLAKNDDANRVTVRQKNGIRPLVFLVEKGTEEQKENAAAALWNLAVNNAVNKATIAKEGGIPPLIALVREGRTEEQKENAAGALRNLAANEVNSVTIAKEGGIPPLVTFAKCGDASNAWAAKWALKTLASNPTLKKQIQDSGGSEFV